MNYAVIWTKKAIDQLAQAWIDANDRSSVQRASNRIDSMVAMQPWAHGESRSGTDRLLFESPLAVFYRIDDSDRKVFVLFDQANLIPRGDRGHEAEIKKRLEEWKRRRKEEAIRDTSAAEHPSL